MRKKLLISLRHPGPADSICSILDYLYENYNIVLLITDSALSFVLSRHPKVFKETIVYVFTTENEFQIYDDNLSVKKCEFQYDDKVQYEKFYKKLFSFVKSVNPDIILRTTPAYLWGADELLPRIVYELGSTIKIKCYQEYYSVGNALNNNEHPIASVGISCFWYNENRAFRNLKNPA